MRPSDPNQRALLAGEYVLGTLVGVARRRFERLMAEDPGLRKEVEDWERRLAPLAETAPSRRPPEHVWDAIAAAVGSPRPPAWWERIGVWRGATALATAVALALALWLALPAPPAPRVSLAVLADASARGHWLVRANLDRGSAVVHSLAAAAPPTGKRFELWAIPAGGPPRSLGLMPQAEVARLAFSPEAAGYVAGAIALAVSLEPPGGSPTGSPTGPVLFQGALRRADGD